MVGSRRIRGKQVFAPRTLLEAFDSHLIGEEVVDGRPALRASGHGPIRAITAHGKFGKDVLQGGRQALELTSRTLVDQRSTESNAESFRWVLFVARVQRGSHIILGDRLCGSVTWRLGAERLDVGQARILFLKNLDMDRILNYSGPIRRRRRRIFREQITMTFHCQLDWIAATRRTSLLLGHVASCSRSLTPSSRALPSRIVLGNGFPCRTTSHFAFSGFSRQTALLFPS